jgi:hypothetical protein
MLKLHRFVSDIIFSCMYMHQSISYFNVDIDILDSNATYVGFTVYRWTGFRIWRACFSQRPTVVTDKSRPSFRCSLTYLNSYKCLDWRPSASKHAPHH